MKTVFEKIAEMPLAAVLRGVSPEEVVGVCEELEGAGFRFVEVTTNSPDWQDSLRRIRQKFGARLVLAGGTVLTVQQAEQAAEAGAEVLISPNFDPDVVRRTKELGLVSAPGCFTPSECFDALKAGADILKIFPAEVLGLPFIKGMKAVLPKETRLCPTGGVTPGNLADFLRLGVFALGMGSALYAPGKERAAIRASAEKFVSAYRQRPH
ncbi:2-dehydro-3-deoxy-6-phosphogalactonate aldolase [Sneathiella chinensis]|uniref:2-dehydro-3-deoxy-6-phosphogalactonate aldolase n=1 Tax=Sneathiella chinensis TaxID=349750 RepID=A0ABQ5U676_9PROT|nr:2-dehydro-3-deoxy-6-phosphogalactonate aldolase [Sneathiella chinensis]GLQ06774.1 2-dehydro-3-deoxy-6-phosphogalactonate aldolase [Sneathiella chinensis]